MGHHAYTPQEQQRLDRNREAMISLVRGDGRPQRLGNERTLGIELERLILDPVSGQRIPFEGPLSISTLLARWERFFAPECALIIDDTLFGYEGTVTVENKEVGISITLEPGAQLEVAVGPSNSVSDLLGAILAFDEQYAQLCQDLGVEWQLVALGTDPFTINPREVALIPKERYRLMDKALSHTGRYARDMMRCSASTQISLDCSDEQNMVAEYRLAVALGPLLAFLCDNVISWRGLSVGDTPRMVRARIWDHMDPARCGIVPGTFDEGFGAEAYVQWLMGVCPILFTDDSGLTIPTCSATEADIMAMRELSQGELFHLLSMVFPTVRLKGFLEIRTPDSMPPQLAAALAAFIKGIFYNDNAFAKAGELFRDVSAQNVMDAQAELEEHGWDAKLYGLPCTTLVMRLVQLAENGLQDQEERDIFHAISSLWLSHMVPKDLYKEQFVI